MTGTGAGAPPAHDPDSRGAALQRLREWRTAVAVGGAGAVVLFGAVAAVTIPGQQQAAASSASGQSVDGVAQDQGGTGTGIGAGGLRGPRQGPGFAGGPPQAVSGGS